MSTRFADSYYLVTEDSFCNPECLKLTYQSRKLCIDARDQEMGPCISVSFVVEQPDDLRILLGVED